jgi:hypothetical protein
LAEFDFFGTAFEMEIESAPYFFAGLMKISVERRLKWESKVCHLLFGGADEMTTQTLSSGYV